MEAYTKKITCPDHKTHGATLYMFGHKYEGIWECDIDGTTEECGHVETHIETVECNPSGPDATIYSTEVCVCNECECNTDADPAVDKADLMAEMSYDCD